MIKIPAVFTPENQQAMYRRLLEATAYPGRVLDLSGWLDDAPSVFGLLATLLDHTVTFCDKDSLLSGPDTELLECEWADAGSASFVLCDGRRVCPSEFQPELGTIYRPELGATLILQGEKLGEGSTSMTLFGPGIASEQTLCFQGFDRSWFDARAEWVSGFPAGVDLILCANSLISVLPRTTRIQDIKEG